jgi:hypothetical protein
MKKHPSTLSVEPGKEKIPSNFIRGWIAPEILNQSSRMTKSGNF